MHAELLIAHLQYSRDWQKKESQVLMKYAESTKNATSVVKSHICCAVSKAQWSHASTGVRNILQTAKVSGGFGINVEWLRHENQVNASA